MAQNNPRPNRDRDPRDNQGNGAPEPNTNWRGLILFAAAIALIGGALWYKNPYTNARPVSYPEFREALDEGRIIPGKLALLSETGSTNDTLRGFMTPPKVSAEKEAFLFKTAINPHYDTDILK